ncbi:chromate efflux transporter [Desulfovibrio sp. OttesenSCG-928-A18]|nr:chromate efflux transporter [Desulfovibrio sp. OttesenSCG-928-A18]
MTEPVADKSDLEAVSLIRIFTDCIILGCTAWGGYMSLLAQAQTRFVTKRKWISDKGFLDMIALVSMLPGPQAVNAIALLGYRLRGWTGFFSALIGTVLPGFLFILFLWKCYYYFSDFQTLTRAVTIGVLPPLAMIIAKAAQMQALGSTRTLKEKILAAVCALSLLLLPYWGTSILVIIASALVAIFFWKKEVSQLEIPHKAMPVSHIVLCIIPVCFIIFNIFPSLLPDLLLAKIGLVFAGISTSLFGGGLVVVPLLQGLLINDFGWLEQSTFNVALAASQLTPGPVLSVATFAGMQLAGIAGAALATIGTYFPTAFITVGASSISEKFLSMPVFQKAMAGIRCAVVGLIAGAAITLLLKLPFGLYPLRVLLLVANAFFLVWFFKLPPYISLPLSCLLAWIIF